MASPASFWFVSGILPFFRQESVLLGANCLNRQCCFADSSERKRQSLQLQRENFFASVNMGEQNPFDFFRTLVGEFLGYY